jgi:hypothetical protein
MFEPRAPEIRAVAGERRLAIDLRFKDVAFVSTGDGFGYKTVLKRASWGVSRTYDLAARNARTTSVFAAWVTSPCPLR